MPRKSFKYELIDHTADLGAVFYGDTPEEVVETAALALFDLMVERPPETGSGTATVRVEGADRVDLLVAFLGELLYLYQVGEKTVTAVRRVELADDNLTAVVETADFDFEAHGVKNEIKAATYHQALFEPFESGWRARVIFDL